MQGERIDAVLMDALAHKVEKAARMCGRQDVWSFTDNEKAGGKEK